MLQFQAITLFPSFDMTQQHQFLHSYVVLGTWGHTSYPPCCWPSQSCKPFKLHFLFFIHIFEAGRPSGRQGCAEFILWSRELWNPGTRFGHNCNPDFKYSHTFVQAGDLANRNALQRLCPSSDSNRSSWMFCIRRWELFREYCMSWCTTHCVPQENKLQLKRLKHDNSFNHNGSIYSRNDPFLLVPVFLVAHSCAQQQQSGENEIHHWTLFRKTQSCHMWTHRHVAILLAYTGSKFSPHPPTPQSDTSRTQISILPPRCSYCLHIVLLKSNHTKVFSGFTQYLLCSPRTTLRTKIPPERAEKDCAAESRNVDPTQVKFCFLIPSSWGNWDIYQGYLRWNRN